MMPYERLKARQCSHRLVLAVYRATGAWPKREQYGLTAQVRRAAVSVPANIAEGSAKRGNAEFGHHLDIVLGSFSELTYLLLLSVDLGILTKEEWEALESLRAETGKLLWGLYRRVRPARQARGQDRA